MAWTHLMSRQGDILEGRECPGEGGSAMMTKDAFELDSPDRGGGGGQAGVPEMKRGENRQAAQDEGREWGRLGGRVGRRRAPRSRLWCQSPGSGWHAGRNAERAAPPILGLKRLRTHVHGFPERIHSPS